MSLPKAASGEKPYGRRPLAFIDLHPSLIKKMDSCTCVVCGTGRNRNGGCAGLLIPGKGQACFHRVAQGNNVLGKERTEAGKRFIDRGFARTEERQRRIIAFTP